MKKKPARNKTQSHRLTKKFMAKSSKTSSERALKIGPAGQYKIQLDDNSHGRVYGHIDATIPNRDPDMIFNAHAHRTQQGNSLIEHHLWFKESVYKTVNYEYTDHVNLKPDIETGAISVCPLLGMLMHTNPSLNGWQYFNKPVTDLYNEWLVEHKLLR